MSFNTVFNIYRSAYLLLIVERAKKCLDFTVTMYIIHLFICLIYGGLPSSIAWWVVNGIGAATMAVLGEWLCIRRELREIPTRSSRASKCSFASLITVHIIFLFSSITLL